MNKFKKAFAAVVLLFTFASSVLVAHELHHYCKHEISGGDCPVCLVVQVCEQNLKLLALAFAAFHAFVAFHGWKRIDFHLSRTEVSDTSTLITQKIRLND